MPAPVNGPLKGPPESLTQLLDAVQPQGDEDHVSVGDMLERVGGRSFPAVIMVPAVLLVSPLSGIPGTPTLGALIVLICAFQGLLGRDHLWLPGLLTRRSVSSGKLQKAVNWLRRPAAFMDRHSKGRFHLLTAGPMRLLAFAISIVIALSWPVLELLPFFTSFSAGATAMIMFGLMTRDGAYLLAGYVQSAVIFVLLVTIWTGLV
ncbi:exopolysaccharide biosynthesis protein [Tropicibacter oceani]|uniref:Exopolysaccharide biosynthesis protein n=1 Tax=Tropicibacter oceani TaxID=3058420 RepID=A0ABY8QH50_9RHOB|nr:exopolysaccharide biosynthesis protein [Tropicibacter oceani]WGW03965.1 exopolysaccharide biosynthesis protein [Tropicibacter oceani]